MTYHMQVSVADNSLLAHVAQEVSAAVIEKAVFAHVAENALQRVVNNSLLAKFNQRALVDLVSDQCNNPLCLHAPGEEIHLYSRMHEAKSSLQKSRSSLTLVNVIGMLLP